MRTRALALAAAAVLLAGAGTAEAVMRNKSGAAAPDLLEPHETVRIEAGKPVTFRWSCENLSSGPHLHDEFRLFQGNQAVEGQLLVKQDVPAKQCETQVEAAAFKGPGTHIWTVRKVGTREKTPKAFSVFKIPE